MKKKILFLCILFSLTHLHALHSMYEEKNVTPDNFEYILDSLETGGSYALILEDDFDFSKLNKDFYETRMIQKIHNLFISDTEIKFYGSFDYIYFNGIQSKQEFYDLREYIRDNPDKRFCIDYSSSFYSRQYDFLPDNCFANHDNVFWVYFGDFLSADIPDGLLNNCKNLIAVYMYNYDKIGKDSFKGCNSKAVIYDMNYNKTLIKNVSKKAEKKSAPHKDWDYLLFDDNFIDDFTEEQQVQKDEQLLPQSSDSQPDENLEYLISLFIDEIKWDELGHYVIVNKDNAKKQRGYKKSSSSVVNTAISFLSERILSPDTIRQYYNPEKKEIDVLVQGKYKFSDFPEDTVFYVFDEAEYEQSISVGFEFSKDGKLYKDLLLIEFFRKDNTMIINTIYTGLLRELLLEELQGTQFQGDISE